MASNNPNVSRPNRCAPRANTLPLPYLAANSVSNDFNSSRSSFASSAPLVRRRQSTASTDTPIIQAQNIELRPPTTPVTDQVPTTNPPGTNPPETNPPETNPPPTEIERRTQQLPHPSPPILTSATPLAGDSPSTQNTRKDWKSWKIGWPWLSFLLFTVVSLVAVIAALEVISRRNSGFVRQSNPPPFLARNPALERAIWSQGILYTAFPAFIMTIYRTMWEAAVTSFADRQPYVDLKKSGGRPAQSTIMLDYRASPFIFGWWVALRNKHFLLAACMFFSVVLALLVVPLVSFLFTTASFASNITLPLSFETSFNPNILGEYPSFPDLRLPLDTAAAMRVQDASRPPWTDGRYAFGKFVPLMDVGDGSVTLETTAYSVQSDCVHIPESQYRKTILTPGETGIPALSIAVNAHDRGCPISNYANLQLTPNHPDKILRIWATTSCTAAAGWSRFSILTARYTNATAGVTNFSLISCVPSYRITSGTLVATTGPVSAPLLRTFAPNLTNASHFRPDALWRFFETEIQAPRCVGPATSVESNEFGRHVYEIASKEHPPSPLHPEAVMEAAQTLFATTFAVFASTVLFKPRTTPLNGTGIHSMEETRLIVVSPVAYIVLGVLGAVAVLNIALFFYARQASMLCEEPVGLVSAAGILHNSDVITMVKRLAQERDFDGKMKEAVRREDKLHQRRYYFTERGQKIVCLLTPP